MHESYAIFFLVGAVLFAFMTAIGISTLGGWWLTRKRIDCPRCGAKALRMEGGTKGLSGGIYYECEACAAKLKNSGGNWSDVDAEEWARSA